jgi:hypothetical protein
LSETSVPNPASSLEVLQKDIYRKVRQRKERENIAQVEPILGESADPRLPNELPIPKLKRARADSRLRGFYNSAELYDPATGRFSPTVSMSAARYQIREAAALLADGRVLMNRYSNQLEKSA